MIRKLNVLKRKCVDSLLNRYVGLSSHYLDLFQNNKYVDTKPFSLNIFATSYEIDQNKSEIYTNKNRNRIKYYSNNNKYIDEYKN